MRNTSEKAELQDVAYLASTPWGCAILRLLKIYGPATDVEIERNVHRFSVPPGDTPPDKGVRAPLYMDIQNAILEKFMELSPNSQKLRLTALGESVIQVMELVSPEELDNDL